MGDLDVRQGAARGDRVKIPPPHPPPPPSVTSETTDLEAVSSDKIPQHQLVDNF